MSIATLTTDFGLTDYYVAILKGAMLSRNEELQIVDVTHNVKPYDIVQGAFVLKNAYLHFPENTIHLVSVNNLSGRVDFIAFRMDGHYFVGPDNGIFSLMFDELPAEVYRIEYDGDSPFPLKDIFADAVEHLSFGKPLHEIGLPASQFERRIALQPVISTSQIRGSVIYIDHYENAVVNVPQELFEKVRNDRRFALYFKRNDPITQLSTHYHDVPIGETLCLFNSAGYLEIAVNMGKASSLLGLKLDDMVQVDFF
ncbi:MAG: SAM-dependent chlorinase/fluorinase [Bacteroidota bacterium]